MATPAITPDALLCLRHSIATNQPPILTTSSEASASNITESLAQATHIQFNRGPGSQQILALSTPTRFQSSGKAIDLRSIVFAWQKKDDAIPDYINATRKLNEELAEDGNGDGDGARGTPVQNLVFAEKLDLITWLEGASNDSEFIQPLDEEAAKAHAEAEGAVDIATGAVGGVATNVQTGAGGAQVGRTVDPRLREIYNMERKMGDRNTVLRGIKPTDFSHVRKHAEAFLGRNRNKPGRPAPPNAPSSIPATPSLVQNRSKPGRRPEPIILLSPSASSLLRMSNIKSFLDNGFYTPPDSTTGVNILHISRLLPSVDPKHPLRFILVDTPDQFKPDYWSRVVAVFTTGQTWQFKSYKWQNPPELFTHALGIFVGWRGEDVPKEVRGWGRGVSAVAIDKYNPAQGVQGRWRDREVVEGVWTAIEESMRSRGWSKEGAAMGR